VSREEWIAKLTASKKVTFITPLRDGVTVMLHTRDEKLVLSLEQRGAHARWFDRTYYSTHAGKSKADFQADVTLGPRFWDNTEVPA
jgi:hypothetical protein